MLPIASRLLEIRPATRLTNLRRSANRQSEKYRSIFVHCYDVNFDAELGVMLLQDRIDGLSKTQKAKLLVMQQQQLDLLGGLLKTRSLPAYRARCAKLMP